MFNQSISPMSSFISVSPKNNTPSKKKRQQASKMQKCFSLGPPKNPTKKTLVQHLAQPKWTDSLSIHIHQILDQKNICIIHKICPSNGTFFGVTQPSTIHHPPQAQELGRSAPPSWKPPDCPLNPGGWFTDPCLVFKSWDLYIFPEGYVVRNIYIYNLYRYIYIYTIYIKYRCPKLWVVLHVLGM